VGIKVKVFNDSTKEIKTNVPLATIQIDKEYYSFNEQHNIDVAIALKSGVLHPVEVKLGITNRCEKFPRSYFDFKKNEIKVDKNNKQFSGNMITILDERSLNDKKFDLKAGSATIDRDWSIVIRREPLKFWKECKRTKNDFLNLKYVFVLEDMWRSVDPKDQEDIKESLVSLLKSQLNKNLD
jgi:hypothetical protein